MKKIIPAVKGTRDFYPQEMAIRNWLYNMVRQVSELFGYQEYEAPILESLELYAAKSGEELVKEQSFVFPDRGGDLITLRPELTPSLSRMVAQRQNQLIYPLRWWSFGPFWRYERPQKGRTREFFQWNVDFLGIDSPEADAELIALVATFFQKVGLTKDDVVILVNNRQLMEVEFIRLGIPVEKKTEVSNLIDRRNKMSPAEWELFAGDIGLNPEQVSGLKRMLDDGELWKTSPDLVRLFNAINAMDVQEYVRFDANIVRGLLYYTGTVFEAYSLGGNIRRSILGGGRYNNLLSDVGGESLPATGFAMGDVIITLLLEELGKIPSNLFQPRAQVLVTIFDEASFMESLRLGSELRQAGINVLVYPEAEKLGKQFKFADRIGVQLTLIIGPDEVDQGAVAVKNLRNGNQQLVRREDLAGFILEQVKLIEETG